MGRSLALLLTAILGLCIVVQLSTKGGSGASRGGVFLPFLALGILWAVVLWEGMPAGLRVSALVVFFLLLVAGAVLPAFQAGLTRLLDRPGTQAPVTLGSGSSGRAIAIVFHAGGSSATKAAMTRIGRDLAARGHTVSMLSAGPRVVLDQGRYRAIILGSPVYSGEVRPPVLDFVSANAPLSTPVFAVLTGWFPAMKEQDLGRLSARIGRAGGRLIAGTKIGSGSSGAALEKDLAFIESSVAGVVGRN